MSTEKRRKFALSGIFRRRRTDKPTEEVGIDLLHPVDDGDPTKSIPSNAGGSGDEDIGKVRNKPLTTRRILVYQLFFYLLTFHGFAGFFSTCSVYRDHFTCLYSWLIWPWLPMFFIFINPQVLDPIPPFITQIIARPLWIFLELSLC